MTRASCSSLPWRCFRTSCTRDGAVGLWRGVGRRGSPPMCSSPQPQRRTHVPRPPHTPGLSSPSCPRSHSPACRGGWSCPPAPAGGGCSPSSAPPPAAPAARTRRWSRTSSPPPAPAGRGELGSTPGCSPQHPHRPHPAPRHPPRDSGTARGTPTAHDPPQSAPAKGWWPPRASQKGHPQPRVGIQLRSPPQPAPPAPQPLPGFHPPQRLSPPLPPPLSRFCLLLLPSISRFAPSCSRAPSSPPGSTPGPALSPPAPSQPPCPPTVPPKPPRGRSARGGPSHLPGWGMRRALGWVGARTGTPHHRPSVSGW